MMITKKSGRLFLVLSLTFLVSVTLDSNSTWVNPWRADGTAPTPWATANPVVLNADGTAPTPTPRPYVVNGEPANA